MADADDTIYALSSGQPPAGIAVIRISGKRVRFGLETLVGSVPEPRRAELCVIRGGDGAQLDRGLVLYFPAPASFTGEDVAELHIHGGRATIAAVLDHLQSISGLRPAEAGEFTRRAFLNRRMDLTQVEGLADLISAETEAQRRQALRQSEGALGEIYEGWRARLIRARALIEAELDFPDEDDVPATASDQVWDMIADIEKEIVRHLGDRRGERIRDGFDVVVLGPPNAGKSSLINAIARREVAIVTSEPGTTRDLIEVRLDLGGYPVTLVDTAGIREATGAVEREGIRRAQERADSADLVLWLQDATALPTPLAAAGANAVRVLTKIDLVAEPRDFLGAHAAVSAKTGKGIEDLLLLLTRRISAGAGPSESPLVTRARHRAALDECIRLMHAATDRAAKPIELRAEDLRQAADALGRITGRIDVEDILDVIFRDFCIGK